MVVGDREQRPRPFNPWDLGDRIGKTDSLAERADPEHRHGTAVQDHPVFDALSRQERFPTLLAQLLPPRSRLACLDSRKTLGRCQPAARTTTSESRHVSAVGQRDERMLKRDAPRPRSRNDGYMDPRPMTAREQRVLTAL